MTYNAEINPLLSGAPAPAIELEEPTHPDQPASAYKNRLKRWAIARIIPNLKPEVMARFRSRSDADGHLDSFRQRFPSDKFLVVFDKHDS